MSLAFNYLHTGYFFMHLLSSAGFFSKLTFSKNSFRNTLRVSNSLDPEQDQHIVGPDLGLTVCKGNQQTTKVATSTLGVMTKNVQGIFV